VPTKKHRVVLEPMGRTLQVPDGQTLMEAAREAGIHLEAPCGGKGSCGGCRIEIPESPPEPSETERKSLSGEELDRNVRLACQVRVHGDMRVAIPEETLLGDQDILEEGVEREVAVEPNVRKVAVHLPRPSVADQRADADRLIDGLAEQGLADLRIDMRTIRDLPDRLRSLDFHPAAIVIGDEIVAIDRPDQCDACYGFAVDIGTTTLVGYLVDLRTGKTVAVASRTNPQAAYGDDVIARIEYCIRDKKNGLRTLNGLVIGALNEILAETCRKAAIKPSVVYEASVVGNTTMNHMFLRLPVEPIALAPFVAASSQAHSVPAKELGLKISPHGRVFTGPLIGSFVGADTVAVIVATGMYESDRLRLAIDIGTNGEIVLGTRTRMLASSTAAGPAFEGARIRYGMRAAAGAIDRVDLVDPKTVQIHTIGNAPPLGICGTGLIDAVAVLLEAGVIRETGLMKTRAELGAEGSPLADRIVGADGDAGFLLASKSEAGGGHPILLTQRDIREVQLAKGAIAAGIGTLLETFGATLDDVDAVLLAGAFGNKIRPERARAVGLIPPLPLEKIRFVGNAAGVGAKMLLVSRTLRRVADDVARGVEHVELSCRPDFQMRFAEAMFFPA